MISKGPNPPSRPKAIVRALTLLAQLLFRRAELDNLSSVVAPAILAVYSLNLAQISYMDAAVALFGYYISERLEVRGPICVF